MSAPIFLPALQGAFGDWTYYVALVSVSELVERVGYARQLQSNARLSELIQRRLDEDKRASDIAKYLTTANDRFFNAIVVGVLGGAPAWHPFALSSRRPTHDLGEVVERDQDLVGYLELRGDEALFALDGQHRLAGIKRALHEKPALATEKLSVIFVPHQSTRGGIRRTRSLFIALNKKAVPVKRRDIIALDEVDLAAIVTRQLLDDHPWFSRGQIDLDRFANSMPATSHAWTTIGNFYDVNKVLIYEFIDGRNPDELSDGERNRIPEERIEFYKTGVLDFFRRLAQLDPDLRRVFDAPRVDGTAERARDAGNPHLLFRPVGLKIISKAVAELRKTKTVDQTFQHLARVPFRLDRRPFLGTIWESDRGRMNLKGESLATRLLVYMLGLRLADDNLRQSYADWLGVARGAVRLPNRFAD